MEYLEKFISSEPMLFLILILLFKEEIVGFVSKFLKLKNGVHTLKYREFERFKSDHDKVHDIIKLKIQHIDDTLTDIKKDIREIKFNSNKQ